MALFWAGCEMFRRWSLAKGNTSLVAAFEVLYTCHTCSCCMCLKIASATSCCHHVFFAIMDSMLLKQQHQKSDKYIRSLPRDGLSLPPLSFVQPCHFLLSPLHILVNSSFLLCPRKNLGNIIKSPLLAILPFSWIGTLLSECWMDFWELDTLFTAFPLDVFYFWLTVH